MINQKILQLHSRNCYIYIDGSVRGNATENIQGISGLRVYDDNYNIIDELYITIENWISLLKAETVIFLISLLITFSCHNVQILSDSELVINRFLEIVHNNTDTTVRNMFKEKNNILIWAIIRQLIKEPNFVLPTIIKVKSHAEDIYHNDLDISIKTKYGDVNRTYLINFNLSSLSKIPYVLLWKDIVIEKKIRKFITEYTEIKNFKQFLNLNRNLKYQKGSVNWIITFDYLKEHENMLTTKFWTSRRWRKKVQRLIEELPTIEQCKKSFYKLIKNWKCPRCERKKETFNHVWMCRSNKKKMKKIISKAFQLMFNLIKEKEQYNLEWSDFFKIYDDETYSKLVVSDTDLTFIDIIKGIFPSHLHSYLLNTIKMTKEDITEIAVKFLNFIYDETLDIWKQRCDLQIDKEKKFRITSRKRKPQKVRIRILKEKL